ncbi:MAG: dihydrolipoyl dehydrogenase family protein [Solirubrobacteraceae bacterium]|nr:MAG: pyridine nucleotide-disulfide oxidoreductase [Solirubrobacterales bacterium]
MADREFDVIVIGAGPAGEVAAGRLVERGSKRVALIEQELVGGECSFYACMPSKALLRPQELLREAQRVPGIRVQDGLDAEAVLERRDEVIHNLDDAAQLPWLKERGIELIRGHGRLAGERRVEVDGDTLLARDAIIVAVGSGASMPPIPGLKEVGAWSNRELTTTREIPRRLVIIGGGVVGVEMAQAWRSLGSEVTVVEGLHRLVAREEPFVCEQIAETFAELGIAVHVGEQASAVAREGDEVVVTLQSGVEARADRVLVAVGRRPHTGDLGLETVGLQAGRSIEVDERMRVPGHDGLYAVGDVNGRALLTHMGKYQARLAVDDILGRPVELRLDGLRSPRVVFTDPQVAAVGHTAASAEEAGISTRVIDVETSGTAGASFVGRNAPGKTRFVVDQERDVLVGATFMGAEVCDFVQAATIAVVGEVPLSLLAHAVAPFPTRSELWLKFTEEYGL